MKSWLIVIALCALSYSSYYYGEHPDKLAHYWYKTKKFVSKKSHEWSNTAKEHTTEVALSWFASKHLEAQEARRKLMYTDNLYKMKYTYTINNKNMSEEITIYGQPSLMEYGVSGNMLYYYIPNGSRVQLIADKIEINSIQAL